MSDQESSSGGDASDKSLISSPSKFNLSQGQPVATLEKFKSAKKRKRLLHYKAEVLAFKDFISEIRAVRDVEQFVHQAELMLDFDEKDVFKIIEQMIIKVVAQEKDLTFKEAFEEIFIPGSSSNLANIIQGVTELSSTTLTNSIEGNSLEHDQSWLCAMCNVSKVSRRHMIIARFKDPTYMASDAREVRLFVLIVTPMKEKATKDSLETGRTFATMLADDSFRQKLLKASDDTEFRAIMVVRSQQLSGRCTLKNRVKYPYDPALQSAVFSLISMTSSLVNLANDPEVATATNRAHALPMLIAPPIHEKNQSVCGIAEDHGSNCQKHESGKANHFHISNLVLKNANPLADRLILGHFFEHGQLDTDYELKKQAIEPEGFGGLRFGVGIRDDFQRRIRFYWSDFRDAFIGPPRTIQKTVATIWFLYFSILLPTIAFSSLNLHQTNGHMGDLRKALVGQVIGGLSYALLGGQPLVIVMTTAPLCLYIKVINQMCNEYGFHFPALYAAVGLWNAFFLMIYSLFGFSILMKWSTRGIEEVFALFGVVALISYASRDLSKNFNKFYYTKACDEFDAEFGLNPSNVTTHHASRETFDEACRRDASLLFLMLMLGTVWLGLLLYKFRKTPYLSPSKRELLADYALPVAVITMSFVGSYMFKHVYVEKLPTPSGLHLERAKIESLPWSGVLVSGALGFTLSLLFFMDQNISAAMVHSPQNKLKKGTAYHYDLLVIAVLNIFLSMFGFPMMHGLLPQSPLHVRSLSDIEDTVEEGHVHEVVSNCRENRVTALVTHLLLLVTTLLLIPYPIDNIPRSVLNGLFLYIAITSLDGFQIFDRLLLLVTEQAKYPPNHYIRRCPQRTVHEFTFLQLFQLFVMCLFGFAPFNIIEMFFPLVIMLMIPFRHAVVPKLIETKYLDHLDGVHHYDE